MPLSPSMIPLLMRRPALARSPTPRPPGWLRPRQPLQGAARRPAPTLAPAASMTVDAEVDLAQRVRESGEW